MLKYSIILLKVILVEHKAVEKINLSKETFMTFTVYQILDSFFIYKKNPTNFTMNISCMFSFKCTCIKIDKISIQMKVS